MLNSKLNLFTSSESESLKDLLRNPKEDFQKIISLVERKIEDGTIVERKIVESALIEREKSLRSAQSLAQIGHFELNADTLGVTGSDELFNIFDLTREEATLEAFAEVVHPDDREYDLYHIRRGLETGESWDIEHRLVLRDGTEKWVHAIGEATRDESGKISMVMGTVQDITIRKKIEESLEQERFFTETAIDSQRDTFFIFNPSEGRAIRWNRAFKDASGYSDEEISIMKAPDSYYDENDLKKAASTTEKIRLEGEAVIEMNLITKDGEKIPFEYIGSSINDDEGNLKYIIVIGRNIGERKESERVIQKSQRNLKKAQKLAQIGHWELNPLTMEVTGSKELFKIFGLTDQEASLDAFASVVHPDDKEYDLYHIQRGIEKGESWDIEHRLVTKDGVEKWVHAIGEVNKDENGNVTLVLGTIQDITERKHMEEILYQERDLIQTLLENHPDFIYFKDKRARFQHLSKRFCEFLNRNREDIIGNTDLVLFPEEVAKQTYSEDLEVIQTGTPLINKEETDGEIWVLTTKLPWFDKDGNIKGLFGISRDITERKNAEQKLRESEENFRNITEQLIMGIAILHGDRFIYVNQQIADIFGYTPEEMVRWEEFEYAKLIHPEDQEMALEQARKKQLGLPGAITNYQFRGIMKDGLVRWMEIFSKGIYYQSKLVDLITIIDVSEQKKAEDELIKLNKIKSELLRRTSHELKTPLVSIKGFTNLLLELHGERLDYFTASNLNEIKQGCIRLESLIADILKTAELESSNIQPQRKEEDLSFLIKLCVNELRGSATLRNHTIDLKMQDNLIAFIEKEQIHQVISNLLNNAIKYTPPNGIIEINSEIRNNFLVISIKDSGIGFTSEEKSGLFKQFGKIERFGQG